MSKDANTELLRCLQELHLPTMRAQHEAVARQATEQSWGYAAYLLELVQRECQQRRHNRIERLLKASRLPLEKSWSALDLKRLPTRVVQQLRAAERRLCGSASEHLDVRSSGSGQDARLVRGGSGTGAGGPTGAAYEVQSAGPGSAGGETRSGSEGIAEAAGDLGGLGDRRPGLCGTGREEMEVLFTLLAWLRSPSLRSGSLRHASPPPRRVSQERNGER